ncbi:hypothetical protein THIOM_005259, partial [Candidatus Thiomargarita nelsonii]
MPKISIVLTLAWLAIVFTVPPRAAYAERVSCGTAKECYENSMAKLQKALDIVEAQRVENERLQKKAAEMEKRIVVLETRAKRYIDNGDGTVTDNSSGLIWLKNANCFGVETWDKAR